MGSVIFHSAMKCFINPNIIQMDQLRCSTQNQTQKSSSPSQWIQCEDLDNMDPPKLPLSIFACKTLVSLSLRWFNADGYSFPSNRFQFPSLKIGIHSILGVSRFCVAFICISNSWRSISVSRMLPQNDTYGSRG